ncbi:MAG: sulfatase [Chloroflexota bacterium]|nr:sulfatase [Chloroflexota bacterium]
MNFILIISDTLRYDHLGCHGNEWISTPHIDRFADKSIVFDRAYEASFPTVPTRHDVLTGRYTFTHAAWAPLPRDEVVLAQELGKVGYTSMMILDTPHIIENGYHYDRGFNGWEWIRGQESDRWRTAPGHPDLPCSREKLRNPDRLVAVHQRNIALRRYEEDTFAARTMAQACRWLERNYREHENFFLYVDTFDPHEPWDAPQWYVDMYDPGYEGEEVKYPVYGPTDYLTPDELKHARALYAAEVTLVDRWVGRLLEKIEDLGLLEDTMVIFASDHGFLHGEHGWIGKSHITPEWSRNIQLYEEVARIPFIIHFPGAEPHREQAFIQPPDIMPTLLELAGAADPGTMHGRSLVPILEGEADSLRDFAVTSPTIIRGAGGGVRATITTDEWSFICAGKPAGGEYVTREVDGLAKRVRAEEVVSSELYHLPSDPHQEQDVIAEHPDVASELRARYVAFLEDMGTREEYMGPWRA